MLTEHGVSPVTSGEEQAREFTHQRGTHQPAPFLVVGASFAKGPRTVLEALRISLLQEADTRAFTGEQPWLTPAKN